MKNETVQTDNTIQAIIWGADRLRLLDQRRLPGQVDYLTLESAAEVAQAIRDMVVRGAPAIGITAAYGVALAARSSDGDRTAIESAMEHLAAARPTAVNLVWALARMRARINVGADAAQLVAEARAIHAEDVAQNRHMGAMGAALMAPATRILTHCNTGALATGGYGTALGVVRAAHARGLLSMVYADETRPWLQGGRLTAWELAREGIPARLIADSAAAHLMRRGCVDWVVVGADRIAANGDVANKIGTYGLALSARHHGLRFMVVAPSGTVDLGIACGDDIPIEERPADELTVCGGHPIAPAGFPALNPVFDVTPAALVDVLVTERGVIERPDRSSLRTLMEKPATAARGR